jgi:hypothetical protein
MGSPKFCANEIGNVRKAFCAVLKQDDTPVYVCAKIFGYGLEVSVEKHGNSTFAVHFGDMASQKRAIGSKLDATAPT